MPACPTRERGHNGDSQCLWSGWPVVRGQLCWRCQTSGPPHLEGAGQVLISASADAQVLISATGAVEGRPGPDATTNTQEELL